MSAHHSINLENSPSTNIYVYRYPTNLLLLFNRYSPPLLPIPPTQSQIWMYMSRNSSSTLPMPMISPMCSHYGKWYVHHSKLWEGCLLFPPITEQSCTWFQITHLLLAISQYSLVSLDPKSQLPYHFTAYLLTDCLLYSKNSIKFHRMYRWFN